MLNLCQNADLMFSCSFGSVNFKIDSFNGHQPDIYSVRSASATRVYLRKGRGEERIAKVQDSPIVAESEVRPDDRSILQETDILMLLGTG